MMVRGWLMIGGAESARVLPPAVGVGLTRFGPPPDASDFGPGQWVMWAPASGPPICLVCVELPLPL